MTIKLKLRVLNVCVTNECLNLCSRHLDIEEARERQTERILDEMFYMNSEDKMSPEDYKRWIIDRDRCDKGHSSIDYGEEAKSL